MPAREPTVVEFHEDRRSAVVQRMVAMADAGSGWINLSPGLDVDVPPPTRSGLASLGVGQDQIRAVLDQISFSSIASLLGGLLAGLASTFSNLLFLLFVRANR